MENYELKWIGKKQAKIEADKVACKTLSLASSEFGGGDSLLIGGDNLDALRCLKSTHSGRVKFIYADPPYNTGSVDFVYGDRIKTDLSTSTRRGCHLCTRDCTSHVIYCAMLAS